MKSTLADFIERHSETIIGNAIEFASSVEVDVPLDAAELRDHLPHIVRAIVTDLRTAQTPVEEIQKSEGRASKPLGTPRSAAGTHALHRARSGYSVAGLVSEYRAMRASVLRMWAEADELTADPADITRFNEAIDEAVAESVTYYSAEVERWRDIFLGVLGHDLRSPLSAILMTSELLARSAVDAPVARAAKRLLDSGERMRELLDRLLSYNRAKIGVGFINEPTLIDIAQACRQEVELLQASMPETRVIVNAPDSLRGLFDGGRIREALSNLVVNAAKYGHAGHSIDVSLLDLGTEIELSVSNAGDPISPELFQLMFDPLKRGAVARGEFERTSLGLGLFIVSQIARAHGGAVRGESKRGKTVFTISLPKLPV